MEALLEAIRSAVAESATAETRTAGITACRTIVSALEARAGEPPASAAPQAPKLPVAAIVSAIRNVPPEQLADLLIAKLRTLVPDAGAPAYKFDLPVVKPVP